MTLRSEPIRTQRLLLLHDTRPTAAEVRWLAENRPRKRSACVDGPRPCPWVSCRHHLWLEVARGGALLVSEGGDSCSLDVADRHEWVGLSPDEVAEKVSKTRQAVDQTLAIGLMQVRLALDDKEGEAVERMLEQARGWCILCHTRAVKWFPMCPSHARDFCLSPTARLVLVRKLSILQAIAAFVRKQRSGSAPRDLDESDDEPV